jgi:hypothetical protein
MDKFEWLTVSEVKRKSRKTDKFNWFRYTISHHFLPENKI